MVLQQEIAVGRGGGRVQPPEAAATSCLSLLPPPATGIRLAGGARQNQRERGISAEEGSWSWEKQGDTISKISSASLVEASRSFDRAWKVGMREEKEPETRKPFDSRV